MRVVSLLREAICLAPRRTPFWTTGWMSDRPTTCCRHPFSRHSLRCSRTPGAPMSSAALELDCSEARDHQSYSTLVYCAGLV
eukprot:scaffold173733_cov35-Tisochrysis_lutea.AAC.5